MIEWSFAKIRRDARRLQALYDAGKTEEARVASLALGPEDQAKVFAVLIAERGGEPVTVERIETMSAVILAEANAHPDAPAEEAWDRIFDAISQI